jgi:localization factor PodJL
VDSGGIRQRDSDSTLAAACHEFWFKPGTETPVGENMSKAVPWSVKGVGFDVRAAAQEAARREGMTLSEWLSETISNRAAQAGIELDDLGAAERLDAIAVRLHELDAHHHDAPAQRGFRARGQRESPGGRDQTRIHSRWREPIESAEPHREPLSALDAEALLESAVELFEKRTAKSQRQTADALASVARIVEANDNGAKALKSALSRLEMRLDTIARRAESEPRKGPFAAATGSPARLDNERMSRLESKLNSILAAVKSDPLTQTGAELKSTSSRRSLGEAIAQIARRQRDLEAPASDAAAWTEARADTAPSGLLGRPASQGDIVALAGKIDDVRREVLERRVAPAPPCDLDKLHAEIAHMSTALHDLATQGSVASLENSIRMLAQEIEVSRSEGANETDLRPLERLVAELRHGLAEIDPRTTIAGLESEIRALGSRLDDFGRPEVDKGAFLQMLQQTQEIRDLLTAAASRQAPVEKIEQQVAQLARALDRQQQNAALPNNGYAAAAVTDELRTFFNDSAQSTALEKIEERLKALAAQIEEAALAARDGHRYSALEDHIDRVREELSARIAENTNAQAGTRPLEDLVRGLAEKFEAVRAPNSDARAFEALERQIGELAARLDRSSTGLSSLPHLEQVIGDLFAKLETMRQAALEAAETAARNTTRESLREALAQGAFEHRQTAAGPGGSHEEVTRELAELRDLQDAADRRTHTTLNAVHETLEKVVDRLALLEDELGDARLDPGQSTLASGPAPSFSRPTRSEPHVEPALLDARGTAAAEKPRLEARGPKRRSEDQEDFLIEPGRGFPGRGDKEPASPTDKKRKSDRPAGAVDSAVTGRADFIAAARRAAQAAQAESAAAAVQVRAASLPEDKGAPRANLVEQARHFIAQHRRPVVLSVAALFLVVGAYAVVKSLSHSPGDLSYDAPKQQPQDHTQREVPDHANVAALPGAMLAQTQLPAATAKDPQKQQTISGSDPLVVGSIASKPQDATLPATESTHDLPQTALQSQADTGNAKAEFELASRYAEGRGLARDLKAAAQWYEKAAAQGLASAQYRVGSLYEKGLGVTRDFAQAKAWYQKAAEQGNVRAMHNLAVLMAEGGETGKPDYVGAAQWFRKAAEYGVRDSQYNYAILLARGLGVAQNLSSSYTWFAVAAAQGDTDAGKKCEDVAARLNASDLAAAKAAAGSFHAKTPDPAANDVQWPNSAAMKPPATKAQRPKISQL